MSLFTFTHKKSMMIDVFLSLAVLITCISTNISFQKSLISLTAVCQGCSE